MKIHWQKMARENKEGIAFFLLKMLRHQGVIHPQYVYKVVKNEREITLVHPDTIEGTYINGGIRIPGEITNSFCTLYEIGYFANAMFLNAVVSALPVEKYQKLQHDKEIFKSIQDDIETLSDEVIENAFRAPHIPIISWLTDDVEPYRFRKEMLWGIKKAAANKIIGKISREEIGQVDSDELRNVLWTDEDKDITKTAIKFAKNLCQAKMIQYYLALENFFKKVGLDLAKVPLYFFCSPYHEILELGPDHESLKLLIELHSPENLKKLSSLTTQDSPILIKIPCPNCGESSKKILQGRIKGKDKKTIRLVCATGEKEFRNEHGLHTLTKKGCGYVWEYHIPDNSKELYELFQKYGFSLHVTLSNCLQLFRNAAITPVAHILGDLNIYYDENKKIKIYSPYPGGYGSSAQLFTSVMAVQIALTKGLIAKNSVADLKEKKLLSKSPFALMAHQSPTRLYNPSDIYKDILEKYGDETGPQDAGIFAVLAHGMTHEDIIERSIGLNYYPAEQIVRDIRHIDIE